MEGRGFPKVASGFVMHLILLKCIGASSKDRYTIKGRLDFFLSGGVKAFFIYKKKGFLFLYTI